MENVVAGVELENPLVAFHNSIISDETRRQYTNKLETFLEFTGVQGTDLREKAVNFVKAALETKSWHTRRQSMTLTLCIYMPAVMPQ